MEQQIQLNDHNKQEYPPMHTAEHLLNATMVKTFGCPRSRNAHIERKKSKCDYILSSSPTAEQIQAIENKVNEVINQNLPVTIEFMTHEQAKNIVDLSKLPEDASETLRIIRITRVRDNILKSKERKNIQPTKGGHKMVTCQNYVSLFYRQITSCPSDGGIS